jgi:phosphohistidine phosphatase
MQVWLVRHAVAAERDEFEGPDDLRPLTVKGERQFRDFVDWLAGQTSKPSVIVTSPLVRAVQTAEIARKGFGLKKKDVTESPLLSPGAEPHALIELARRSSASIVSTVALVGHEPDLSRALSEFIGGGAMNFGKGFVAAIDFPEEPALGSGRLSWFVGPKLKSG